MRGVCLRSRLVRIPTSEEGSIAGLPKRFQHKGSEFYNPGEAIALGREETKQALEIAEGLVGFVRAHLMGEGLSSGTRSKADPYRIVGEGAKKEQ